MGVAVFEGDELLFWGVAGFRNLDAHALFDGVERKVLSLLHSYGSTVLAIEKPTPARLKASPSLAAIDARVSKMATSTVRVRHCEPLSIRKRLCGSARGTRQDLARHIVALYPHLRRYTDDVSRWQQEYWMPMFAAVAAGLVCART